MVGLLHAAVNVRFVDASPGNAEILRFLYRKSIPIVTLVLAAVLNSSHCDSGIQPRKKRHKILQRQKENETNSNYANGYVDYAQLGVTPRLGT